MGKAFLGGHPGLGASNTWRKDNLLTSKIFGDSVPDGRQLYEPKVAHSYVFRFKNGTIWDLRFY